MRLGEESNLFEGCLSPDGTALLANGDGGNVGVPFEATVEAGKPNVYAE